MEYQTKFHNNAVVIAAGGAEIGHLSRVVMQPESKEVTHIVVKMKALFNQDERIIPIDSIESTSDSEIILNWKEEEVKSAPLFEEERLIPNETSGPVIPPQIQSPVAQNLPLGFPAPTPAGADKIYKENVQNIREGSVALEEGAKIFTQDGKQVGKLERIVANLPGGQATHLLISKGLVGEVKKLIPITWVKSMSENEILLSVKEETVDEVAKPSDETKS